MEVHRAYTSFVTGTFNDIGELGEFDLIGVSLCRVQAW